MINERALKRPLLFLPGGQRRRSESITSSSFISDSSTSVIASLCLVLPRRVGTVPGLAGSTSWIGKPSAFRKALVKRRRSGGGHVANDYNPERSTDLRDLPAYVPVFNHQTIWEMYEAIGYDVKAKQFVGKEVLKARKEAGMRLNRPNVIYRDGILMDQQRERTSDVPLRYKNTWRVRRIKIIAESEIDQYDRHYVTHDDDGKRVVYTAVEQLGVGLTKRQALALLG